MKKLKNIKANMVNAKEERMQRSMVPRHTAKKMSVKKLYHLDQSFASQGDASFKIQADPNYKKHNSRAAGAAS